MVLVLLAFAAATGAYVTYANPTSETVTETENREEISTSLTTSAIVTGNTSLYEQGERLEERSAYLFRATPVLQFHIDTDVPDDQDVQVAHTLQIRNRASRGGVPFWNSTQTLIDNQTVTSSGGVSLSTSTNVSSIRQIRQRLQSEVNVGIFESELYLSVEYQTETHEDSMELVSPITFSGGGYWLEDPMSDTNTYTEETSRTVSDRDMSTVQLFAAVAILCLLGAVGMAIGQARSPDVAELESKLFMARYDEWISNGEFPTNIEKQYIYIDSLEDLVDLAIDSSKRVIYDSDLEAYSVMDGDLVYYYATDPTVISSWLEMPDQG
jgi:hypothetical protein